MIATLERCSLCGALVDGEDLFCANCGSEVIDHARPRVPRLTIDAKNFHCQGCGASMNYDAAARSLKCPFCGSVHLDEAPSHGILAPECVVPFVLDQAEAETRLRQFLGSSVWHPGDLRTAALVTELRPVFIPCWIFDTSVQTFWTARQRPDPARGAGELVSDRGPLGRPT